MPLGKNADAGDYVKDFAKSDAPQFKGKSKEKRRKMAIAAYLDSKDKKESKMKSFDDIRAELDEANIKEGAFTKKAVETGKVKTGPSKDRMSAMQKQDDNRPTLRKREDVKEISSNKLGDYMRKSAQSAAKPGQSARTQDKRIAGQSMADKKIRKKMGYSSTAKVPAGKNEAAGDCPDGQYYCQRTLTCKPIPDGMKKNADGFLVKEKKMDSAAMKRAMDAFKKRGGKITKVAPGKAAGYHGKDDPGKGMHGMMDRGDTKNMPKKKFMGSMK